METAYYNLSGGINLARTKTELGLDTKKMYWSDSENVEIYKNRGISKQLGNTLLCSLPEKEVITGMFEMVKKDDYKLVICCFHNQTSLVLFKYHLIFERMKVPHSDLSIHG